MSSLCRQLCGVVCVLLVMPAAPAELVSRVNCPAPTCVRVSLSPMCREPGRSCPPTPRLAPHWRTATWQLWRPSPSGIMPSKRTARCLG